MIPFCKKGKPFALYSSVKRDGCFIIRKRTASAEEDLELAVRLRMVGESSEIYSYETIGKVNELHKRGPVSSMGLEVVISTLYDEC